MPFGYQLAADGSTLLPNDDEQRVSAVLVGAENGCKLFIVKVPGAGVEPPTFRVSWWLFVLQPWIVTFMVLGRLAV